MIGSVFSAALHPTLVGCRVSVRLGRAVDRCCSVTVCNSVHQIAGGGHHIRDRRKTGGGGNSHVQIVVHNLMGGVKEEMQVGPEGGLVYNAPGTVRSRPVS